MSSTDNLDGSPVWWQWLKQGCRWLILAPHQDDEVLLAFSVMRLFPRQGTVIFLTDGSKGVETGYEHLSPEEISMERYRESGLVAARLGIRSSQLTYLGLPDQCGMSCGATFEAELSAVLGALFRLHGATLIFTTHPLDKHPDHRLAGRAVFAADGPWTTLYGMVAESQDVEGSAYAVEIPPDMRAERHASLLLYRSQHFLHERVTDTWRTNERFFTAAQVRAALDGGSTGDAKLSSRMTVLRGGDAFSIPALGFLTDTPVQKSIRVTKTLGIRGELCPDDPWCARSDPFEMKRIEQLADLVARGPIRRRIVDAGCGAGHVVEALSDRGRTNLLGVDSNVHFIEGARRRVPQASFLVADLQDLVSMIRPDDLVILAEVSYYFHPSDWIDIVSRIGLVASEVVVSAHPMSAYLACCMGILRTHHAQDVVVLSRSSDIEDSCVMVRFVKAV